MVDKTWVVTSDKPRPSHEAIDGEVQAYGDPFTNGLYYPGDPTGSADETAGCTCLMTVDGEVEPPPEAPPAEADPELLGDDATQFVQDAIDQFIAATPDAALNALEGQVWGATKRLRQAEGDLAATSAATQATVEVADGVFADSAYELPKPVALFRGIELDPELPPWLPTEVGQTFVDHGYQYTSPVRGTAANYAFGWGGTPTDAGWLIRYDAPAGTRVLAEQQAQAFILDRGATYEITSVDQATREIGVRIVDAVPEAVPAPELPPWMRPSLDDALQSPVTEDGAVGTGINAPHWGTVQQADGSTLKVVLKVVPSEEQSAELAAQSFNEDYGFNVLIPRTSENPDYPLVTARAPGRTGLEIYESRVGGGGAAEALQKAVLQVPLEERQSMVLFDQVIGNLDRNDGNWLITADHHLVALDHGLAFTQTGELTFGSGGALFDSAIRESLTAEQMVLTDAQRTVLETMVQDEESIRQQWDGFVDVDAMMQRVQHILDTGQWRA